MTGLVKPRPDAVAFLEAPGFVLAFDAVEAVTKTADVEVGGLVRLGGGLVAMSVIGELGAVMEAVEVAVETLRALHKAEVRSIVFPNACSVVASLARAPNLVGG